MPNDPKRAGTPPAQSDLGGFLQRYGRLFTALVVVSSTPFLTSLVVRIGPPWPGEAGTSSLVCMVNVVLLVVLYLNTTTARLAFSKRMVKWFAITFVAAIFIYIVLKSFFCYDAPDWQHQVAGGFILQPKIIEKMATEHRTREDLLAGTQYDANRIWVPWTVSCVRVVILVVWLILFASLSGIVALGVRWYEDKAKARVAASGTEH